LQGTAEAVPGANAEEVLGTRVEVDEGAVGVDDQDGSGQAAEDVGRRGSCR
jgi:hypothetical protein